MRAITIDDYGTRPRLQDIPKPQAREGEVLIRLRAAGVNPMANSPRSWASTALATWSRLAPA